MSPNPLALRHSVTRHQLLSLLLFAAATAAVFTLTPIKTDMSVFFARGDTLAQRLLADELLAGASSRIVLIGLEGPDTETAVAASRALYAALADHPGIASIRNGAQELSDAERDFLMRYRYLFSAQWTAQSFSRDGLRAALEEQLRKLRSTFAPWAKQTLAVDPLDQFWRVLSQEVPHTAPTLADGVWIDATGRLAPLVAQLRAGTGDLDAQERVVRAINNAFDIQASVPGVRLHLTGAPVFATQSRAMIRDEVTWLSTLSTILVMGVLWLALRRKEYVLLGSLPLLVGVVAGTAAVGALFGSVHGITLAFGATILGVAIDYPIHLFAHLTPGESAAATFRRLWPTLLLVCVTTAVGYGAMALSSFSGLAQLGVFAIAGLVAAVATTGLWLPRLLSARPPPPVPRWAAAAPVALHGARAARIAILATLVALIAAAPLIDPGDPTPWWNDDIQSLNTVSADQRAADARLRGALGAPSVRHLIVVSGADEQDALMKSEALLPLLETLQRDGAIAGFDATARHLPSIATQQARQRLLPEAARVEVDLAQVVTAFPFRLDTFAPFIADLKAASALTPARVADAPPGVMKLRLDTLLRQVGDQWLALIQLRDPLDPARVAAAFAGLQRDDVVALDLQSATASMLRDYRREAVRWAAVGGMVLWLVLALRLRPLGRALFAALPAALAVAGTAAALHLAGVSLTLFHVVALLLVAGLALDYALFFFRADAVPNDHGATLFAIIVCAITTAAVFCALAASSVPILTMLGVTVTLGIALTFVATLALAGFARSTL